MAFPTCLAARPSGSASVWAITTLDASAERGLGQPTSDGRGMTTALPLWGDAVTDLDLSGRRSFSLTSTTSTSRNTKRHLQLVAFGDAYQWFGSDPWISGGGPMVATEGSHDVAKSASQGSPYGG